MHAYMHTSHMHTHTHTHTHSFGLVPGSPLQVQSPLMPNQTVNVVLGIAPGGPVQKMNPLSQLQVAVKNNIDVLYFSTRVPMHVLFSEDGQMGE